MPMITSRAVSITSQSYSEDSSSSKSSWSSSSPISFWQGCDLVRMDATVEVMRSVNLSWVRIAGPQSFKEAETLRLISVTTALLNPVVSR